MRTTKRSLETSRALREFITAVKTIPAPARIAHLSTALLYVSKQLEPLNIDTAPLDVYNATLLDIVDNSEPSETRAANEILSSSALQREYLKQIVDAYIDCANPLPHAETNCDAIESFAQYLPVLLDIMRRESSDTLAVAVANRC